ncbi:MAG: SGNH/GDSL hydrolase family protein [Bacteroidota bacterium]
MLRLLLLLALTMLLIGCVQNEPAPEPTPMAPARIVFFGDSITEAGVQTGGYVTLVDSMLASAYPERSIEIIGAGISGHKVPDLQERLERDVLSRKPTHVVIYIGINDIWHFHKFEGVTGTEADVFEAGLRDLIGQMQAAGVEVALCTPSVIGEDPDDGSIENTDLGRYADISRRVASETGSALCDLRDAFETHLRANNADKAYEGILTTDGVHLNEAGNQFVAEQVVEVLTPLL